jgi:hypothetical protein
MSRANVRSPHNLSATSNLMRAMRPQRVRLIDNPNLVSPPKRTPRSLSLNHTIAGAVLQIALASSSNLCLFCSRHLGTVWPPLEPPFSSRHQRPASLGFQEGARAMHRLYLTAREYEALLKKQGGACCVEDCEETEDLIGEHSTPNTWRRTKPDQLMCAACHKVKTLRDIKAIWKVKRLNGAVLSQYERRRRYGPQLCGRPFNCPPQQPGAPSWRH